MNKSIARIAFWSALILCCRLYPTLPTQIKVRASAFVPTGKLFKRIYGSACANVDVELATTLCPHMQAWINVDWLSAKGHSLGLCCPTKIQIAQCSFGLKVPYDITNCVSLYAGIGPSFAHIRLRNQSSLCNERVSAGAPGVIIKTGANFFITQRVFIDLFMDYLCQKAAWQRVVSVSGLRAGAGIGWQF